MTRTLVVPDLHGNYELALLLLREAGVVNARGTRVDQEVRTVQLGDLANCVAADREGDLKLLRKARAWFDVLLIGNHEYPYLGGWPFAGFSWTAEVERCVLELPWKPALAVGDTLLTHAGVVPGWVPSGFSADEAEALFRAGWQYDRGHPYFRQIGRSRGGDAEYGGILWSDYNADGREDDWNQLHGHTPNRDGPSHYEHRNGRWVFNLDVGCSNGWAERSIPPASRIVGAWLDEHGEIEDIIEAVK